MQTSSLQKFFAHAALFLLVCPVFKVPGISVLYGDMFLLVAMLLNFDELTRIHAFQIPFLLAIPFLLVSVLMDADGDLIAVVQILYIFGVALPFGFAAFTSLTPTRIAQVLLLAAACNSIVGMGQFAGVIGELPQQGIIYFGQNGRRAAGLNIQCNGLSLSMTPMFVLLVYLNRAKLRAGTFLILLGGMASTISKSILFATPGILYYLFYCEPKKRHVFSLLFASTIFVGFVLERSHGLENLANTVTETTSYRLEHAGDSVANRSQLIQIAMDYSQECYLYGFGIEGTRARMMQSTGNTVHVFLIGLVLVGGMVTVALFLAGVATLFTGLWRDGERNYAMYLAAHMLGCLVATVLMLSFQYLPFMVAGAVFVRSRRLAEIRHRRKTVRPPHFAARHPRQNQTRRLQPQTGGIQQDAMSLARP